MLLHDMVWCVVVVGGGTGAATQCAFVEEELIAVPTEQPYTARIAVCLSPCHVVSPPWPGASSHGRLLVASY